MGHVMLLMGTI